MTIFARSLQKFQTEHTMNQRILNYLCASVAIMSPFAMAAGNGIKVEHLGERNTMVRVSPDSTYLLLPVEDSADDSKIDILSDGNLKKSIMVRLAKEKVDFYVPLKLDGLKGSDVILNIMTPHVSYTSSGADKCWSEFRLSNTFKVENTEKYRPKFHHTPEWGWMNDPNGMYYKDGVWTLCYQWNPYGSKWQNLSWGRSTSRDLVNWEHHPVAIEPDGLGMIFSGSSAIDKTGSAGFGEGAVVSMYTSAAASQVQSLGHCDAAGNYVPYPGNPVLTMDSEARDPNMWFDEKEGLWHLSLAHALDHEMLFFTSPDLKEWTLTGSFGKVGAQDGVWECPDLFPLTFDGKEKWVLLCNLNPGGPFGGSATQYFIGEFDGKTFKSDLDKDGNVPTKWLDFGKDHYATVSFSDAPDGRRTVIGWMSNWQYANDVPTTQYRSANTLPRDMKLFRGSDNELYVASVPSPELAGMRGKAIVAGKSFAAGRKGKTFLLPKTNSGVCEISLSINPGKSREVTLELFNNGNEKVTMVYDTAARTFSFDRRESGLTDFSKDFPAVTVAPTFNNGETITLDIFVDTSSIEVFGNNGEFAMTNLVFPRNPYTTLSVKSDADARISGLNIHEIK